MNGIGFFPLLILLFVWMAASTVTGALLALMAVRIHSGLSFPKLWAFYSALMGTLVAVVFLIGWF